MFASAARALLGALACLCQAVSPLFFSATFIAAALLRVVVNLELCTPAMARMDEEGGLMRRKVE